MGRAYPSSGRNELVGQRIGPEQLRHTRHECDEGVDDRGRELRAAVESDLVGRFLQRPGAAVGAVRGHRVDGVGQADDRGLERDPVAPQAVRVAVAVPALVVVEHRGHRGVEPVEPADDPRAVLRVPLHDLELELRQAVRLREDCIGDADLADVVEEPREAQDVESLPLEPELLAECDRDPLHALRVAGEEWPAV